jgi:histidinol-phosphate/aromatic aminotransferase/cobyric acid decarboxylase-like protein
MSAPREHGGPIAAELRGLGIDPHEVLDFSVNVNVYGPAPQMVEAIRTARVDLYPDPTAREAREALGAVCDVDPDRIVVGNGAAELLWTLARVVRLARANALGCRASLFGTAGCGGWGWGEDRRMESVAGERLRRRLGRGGSAGPRR